MIKTIWHLQFLVAICLSQFYVVGGNAPTTANPNFSRVKEKSSIPTAVDALVVNIFQRFNINGDKVLSWKEAQELVSSQMYGDFGGMPAADFFAKADIDGSRTLSKKEITNFYLKWRRAHSARAKRADASTNRNSDDTNLVESSHEELHPCFQSNIQPDEQAECLIRYFESRAEFESSSRDHDAQVSWNSVVEKVETSLKYYLYCMTIPLFGRAWWYNIHGRRHALFNRVISLPTRLIFATLFGNFWFDAKIAIKILLNMINACFFTCKNKSFCLSSQGHTTATEYLSMITIFGGGLFIWTSMPLKRLILGKPTTQTRSLSTLYLVPSDDWSGAPVSTTRVILVSIFSTLVLISIWFICWLSLALIIAGKHTRTYWMNMKIRRRPVHKLRESYHKTFSNRFGHSWRRRQRGNFDNSFHPSTFGLAGDSSDLAEIPGFGSIRSIRVFNSHMFRQEESLAQSENHMPAETIIKTNRVANYPSIESKRENSAIENKSSENDSMPLPIVIKEKSPGEHHHRAWLYLKQHSADWYEETKDESFGIAARVIDLDGDDLFPGTEAGGGTDILSLGIDEETGEDMPEAYYANHDMVGKAPWDHLLESAESIAGEREHVHKLKYAQQRAFEENRQYHTEKDRSPRLQKQFKVGDSVHVRLWSGRWQKTGKRMEYQHKQYRQEEGKISSPLRNSGLAARLEYGQGGNILTNRSGWSLNGENRLNFDSNGGVASHKRFELVNHEALRLVWPIGDIEKVSIENGGAAEIAEMLQPTECMRLAHELMRICNENDIEAIKSYESSPSLQTIETGNRVVGVHIWQQNGPLGYSEAVGRSFAQFGKSVRHYQSKGLLPVDEHARNMTKSNARARQGHEDVSADVTEVHNRFAADNDSPSDSQISKKDTNFLLRVPTLVAQSSMMGVINRTPMQGSKAASSARRLGKPAASQDFNALLRYFIERASKESQKLGKCYTRKNVHSFGTPSPGIHNIEEPNNTFLDVLLTFDLTTPLALDEQKSDLCDRPSHVRICLFSRPKRHLNKSRVRITTHTLHLRVELWRARNWESENRKISIRAAAQNAMAKHVCWTAWKCRFWMNPGKFVLGHRKGSPVGNYFDKHSASTKWERIFPNLTTNAKPTNHRPTRDRRLSPPRVEAAPYSRGFSGRVLSRLSMNGADQEPYFDIIFTDGVLSSHVIRVHQSALMHAKRHYCQYRRIQNNYFWEKRGDSGLENARHYCFGAPPPEELGGPVKSRLDQRIEHVREKCRTASTWLKRRRLGTEVSILKAKKYSLYSRLAMRQCPTCQEWFCAAHLTAHQLCSDKGCNVPESMVDA